MALRTPAPLKDALGLLEELPATDPLPVVFVGHGTPFSVIVVPCAHRAAARSVRLRSR